MNHRTAITYRRHMENGNRAAAMELTQPHALPLFFRAAYQGRQTTFKVPAESTTAQVHRAGMRAAGVTTPPTHAPTQGPRAIVTHHEGHKLEISPHPTARARPERLNGHPLSPYHAAARYRLAAQASKDTGHRDHRHAAALARARAALTKEPLPYLARVHPGGPSAYILVPTKATRRQLMQIAKKALGLVGHPFRPLEYIDPPRIEARANGVSLEIRPAPDHVDDSEV